MGVPVKRRSRRSPVFIRALRFLTVAFAAVALALLAPSPLQAQQALPQGPAWIEVSTDEAASHLIKKADPVYPEFARAAGIEGVVRFSVDIYTDGRIRGFHWPVGGPPALADAAKVALEGYVYRPFQKNGRLVNASTVVEVPFHLPPGIAHHEYPLPHLTWQDFFSPSRQAGEPIPVPSLSPLLRNWYRSWLSDSLFNWMKADERRLRVQQAFDASQAEQIPGHDPRSRVYLLEPQGNDICGHNCPFVLVETRADGVQLIGNGSFDGYLLRPRPGSVYPDIFFCAREGTDIFDFTGYGNIGGYWGQLYCGHIEPGRSGGPPMTTPCEAPSPGN